MKVSYCILFILALAVSPSIFGQTLAADINPGPADASSLPADFIPFRDQVVFSAATGQYGREWWITDGAAAGTYLLIDLFAGRLDGIGGDRLPDGRAVPLGRQAAVLGERLLFAGNDGLYGKQLWATDGSPGGTRRLTALPGGALFYGFTPVGASLFFFTYQPATGWQLWRSNGTEQGTVMIRGDFGEAAPGDFSAAGGYFYFTTEPVDGALLWRSDGADAGTIVVADQLYSPGSTGLDRLSHRGTDGERFFFAARRLGATENPNSVGLWVSAGAFEQTRLLAEVAVVSSGSFPLGGSPVPVDGRLYFLFYDESGGIVDVWSTDGSPAGTRRRYFATTDKGPIRPSNLAGPAFGRLYFNGPSEKGGTAMLAFDPATDRVEVVAELAADVSLPFFNTFEEAASRYSVDSRGRLFLLSKFQALTVDWWTSDGTSPGTYRDTTVTPYLAEISQAAILDTLFLFTALDSLYGLELWAADAAGPRRLLNLETATDAFFGPVDLLPLGEKLVFPAYDPKGGREYWMADAEGAHRLRDILPGEGSGVGYEAAVLGRQVLFAADDGEVGEELWQTDGTPAGTRLLADLMPGAAGSFPEQFTVLGDQLYFIGRAGQGWALWRSDGTTGGTKQVFLFGPDDFGVPVRVRRLQSLGDRLFIVTAFNGQELIWFSDGTEVGTKPVLLPLAGVDPAVRLKEVAYFAARAPQTADVELWRSDGTAAGTFRVRDIRPGPSGSAPADLVVFRDRVVFTADDGSRGRELWISDGSTAGTVLLRELFPGAFDGVTFPYFAQWQDRLYFQGGDATGGRELWSTDGTPAGTRPEADVFAGAGSAHPAYLTPTDDGLLFAAYTPVHGMEVWQLNRQGMAGRLTDIHSGPGHANPYRFTVAGNDVFFIADDGQTGRELWRLALMVTAVTPVTGSEASVYVAPNPVGEELRLVVEKDLPGPLRMRLFDAGGRLVRQWKRGGASAGETLTFPRLGLAGGSYTLQVTWGKGSKSLQVVVR